MNDGLFALLSIMMLMVFILILVWLGVDLRDVSVCKGGEF